MRQHGWVARKTSDAAICVLKYDDVKLSAPSGNPSGNLTDSSEQTELLQQPRGNSTTDVTDHDGLARFDSKYMSRIDTHISATDDQGLYVWQGPRKRGINAPAADCRAAKSLLRSNMLSRLLMLILVTPISLAGAGKFDLSAAW
jgi:hypothetical protein